MKPKEFNKIKEQFEKDQQRWEGLKVGDIIYDEQPRGWEMDYHKMMIDLIDIDERKVDAHDVAGSHRDTLTRFLTEAEFKALNDRFRR